jgi:hypothetical protein
MSFLRCMSSILCIVFPLVIQAQPCSNCNKRTKFNFKIHKREGAIIDTNSIKTNGVYVTEFNTNGQKKYSFIRFFGNGRVYFSCIYCSYPTKVEFNDLKYGYYGHFISKKDEVKAEVYEAYPRYYFVYYSLKHDIIETNGSSKRVRKEPKNRDYMHMNKLKYTFKQETLETKAFW